MRITTSFILLCFVALIVHQIVVNAYEQEQQNRVNQQAPPICDLCSNFIASPNLNTTTTASMLQEQTIVPLSSKDELISNSDLPIPFLSTLFDDEFGENVNLTTNPMQEMTCGQWQMLFNEKLSNTISNILSISNNNDEAYTIASRNCLSMQALLQYTCCENSNSGGRSNIMPLYQCQNNVRNMILFNTNNDIIAGSSSSNGPHRSYDPLVAPFTGNLQSQIDVYVSVYISDYYVKNYGVDGGSIEIMGSLTLQWVDKRLQWDPSEAGIGGCTKVHLQASLKSDKSEIWTPGTSKDDTDGPSPSIATGSKATVLADGSVSWDRRFQVEAGCVFNMTDFSKMCSFQFISNKEGQGLWRESTDDRNVNYIVGVLYDSVDSPVNQKAAILVNEQIISSKIEGYSLNTGLTSLSSSSIDTKTSNNKEITLDVRLDFIDIDKKCTICGDIDSVSLRNQSTPLSNNDGGVLDFSSFRTKLNREDHSATNATIYNVSTDAVTPDNWTCQEINDYLEARYYTSSDHCAISKFLYTEPCCEGISSRNQCEQNVRRNVLNKLDTVTPPDPITGDTFIEVEVRLDFTHILDIDIRSNTLEVLVSLELIWIDGRLAWEPFMGGCTFASYRTSLNAEETEIWVPEIDLLNHVEGVSDGLATSFATASHFGMVWWKRTGTLKVACDLTGLSWFPFDHPGCALDFGAPRSPLAHRVKYIISDNDVIEYSERLRERSAEYQEYHVQVDKTTVTIETESMSNYVNEFVRFHFTFVRAMEYYLWSFIILYIFFTYLSFGMFFLDEQVGERLGFGTGMLFVIVAQDITIWERTPITHQRLWIDILSLGSKAYVILGIAESLVVLYLYFLNDLNGDGVDNELVDRHCNETESLINDNHVVDHSNRSVSQKKKIAQHGILEASSKGDDEMALHSEDGPVTVNGFSVSLATSPLDEESSVNEREDNEIKSDEESVIAIGAYNRRHRQQALKLGPCASWLVENILGYNLDLENDSLAKQKVLKLRLYDRITAVIFFTTYTVFLIVMFVRASIYDNNA